MLPGGSGNLPSHGIRSRLIKTGTAGEVPWDQAREIAKGIVGVGPTEQVPLADADNRVLAVDHCALVDLPSFDNSAMDGWAVSGQGPWEITREVVAGEFPTWELMAGEASSIATGAPIPRGTTAIIRSENGTVADNLLVSTNKPALDIRKAGEECRVGDLMLSAGSRLSPSSIGVLAATGHDSVTVQIQPTIHILVFGDELTFTGVPQPGKIRDSLGPQLPGWLNRMGAAVTQVTHCTDSLAQVAETLSRVTADIVITTGGTASGPRDFLRAVLDQFDATLHVDGVHVRPGHPMILATISRSDQSTFPVIGLPGNPLSAIVGLLTLAQPIVNSILGLTPPPLETLITSNDLYTKSGTRLIAGAVHSGTFAVAEFNGSAMLRGLSHSTGFAVIDSDTPAGSPVHYLPLPSM